MNMRIPFIIAATLMLAISCSEDKSADINQRDEQGRKHGRWVEHYPNGQVKSEVLFEHGEKSGTETVYFENGNPNLVRIWEADSFGSVLDGSYYHFYNDGSPLLRKHYVDGVPHDTVTQFYRNGYREYTGQYDSGMAVGTWKYFDTAGNLEVTINYDQYQREFHDELKTGTYTWYDTAEKPVYRGTWYKGQLDSDTIFDPTKFETMKAEGKIKEPS